MEIVKNRIGNYTEILRAWLEDRLQLPISMDPLPWQTTKSLGQSPTELGYFQKDFHEHF